MDGEAFGQMEMLPQIKGYIELEKPLTILKKIFFFPPGNFNWDSWISEFVMK